MTLLMRDREKFAEGKAEGKAEALRNVMQNLEMSFEEAVKILMIPDEEQELYRGLVN